MRVSGTLTRWVQILSLGAALAGGCGSSGGDSGEDAVPSVDGSVGPASERQYGGSSSEGGGWTFLLDSTERSLTFRRGNDAPMTRHFDLEDKAPLRFFLRVKDQGEESFGWEKPGRFLLHAFPLGTDKPSMFAAVGEGEPADSALVAGSYLWLESMAVGESGTPAFPAWGVLTLRPEGTWSRWTFAAPSGSGEGTVPDSYSAGWPPALPPGEVGTWSQVPGTGQITLAGAKSAQAGRVWTEEGTALLLLETEGGMVVAARAPETPYANADLVKSVPGETDGMHAVMGVWGSGVRWVARCSFPGTQERGFCFYRIPGAVETQDYVVSQSRCGVLPNAFSFKFEQGAFADPPGDWTLYVFAAGSLASIWMIADPVEGVLGVGIGLRQDSADFADYLCDGQLCG